jgi:hypothetical protein
VGKSGLCAVYGAGDWKAFGMVRTDSQARTRYWRSQTSTRDCCSFGPAPAPPSRSRCMWRKFPMRIGMWRLPVVICGFGPRNRETQTLSAQHCLGPKHRTSLLRPGLCMHVHTDLVHYAENCTTRCNSSPPAASQDTSSRSSRA